MRTDMLLRLPPPTAIFLVGSILDLTSAHLLQRAPLPTTTLPHRTFNVQPWGILATPAPPNPFDLFRRQDGATNTICGYIGGNSALPATCSTGSHCVVDTDLNVIGCCPNGVASCTTGIFTGCVDSNSGPQATANPLVYTCVGSEVCYKNQFDGGYSQYGCGTASNLATTVKAAATGITSSLSIPTIGTATRSTRSSSSTSSSTSTSSTTGAPTGTASSRPNPVGAGAPGSDKVGPIVGGVIGGVSVVIALLAFLIFFIRRRRSNKRQGPGLLGVNTTYISPPNPNGSGFTPVHQSNEAFEAALPAHQPQGPLGPLNMQPPNAYTAPAGPSQQAWSRDLHEGEPSPFAYQGAAGAHTSYPPAEGYHYPGQYATAYAGGAPILVPGPIAMPAQGKGKAPMDDQHPLVSEGYQPQTGGLGRIGEEEEDRGQGSGQGTSGSQGNERNTATSLESTSPNSGGRPLWQQNRRQSRTPVWM